MSELFSSRFLYFARKSRSWRIFAPGLDKLGNCGRMLAPAPQAGPGWKNLKVDFCAAEKVLDKYSWS
jgi:hypothetical protein